MTHSIAAKYAARPAARFPTPTPRAVERRLGLRGRPAFRAAPAGPTVLRGPLPSLLGQVRSGARTMADARTERRRPDRPGSVTGVIWAAPGTAPRPSARPAPWRA